MHRLKAQLEDANVDSLLIQELDVDAWACWRYSVAEGEKHFDPEIGHVGSTDHLDKYEDTESRVHDALRRRWWQFWSE